jgi:cell division protein FtsQ
MKAREPSPLLSTRGMQRLARLMVAAAIALLAAGAVGWLCQRPWFDLTQVELRAADADGLRHVNVNAVRAAAVGRLRGNFFTMRLEEARRVFESVPWVAAVSLRRAWPDRLVVTLAEHRAIAVWDDGRLLADGGQLFVANVAEAEVHGPLPVVDASPRFSAEAARRLPQLAAWAASLGLELEAVELSDRASWTLRTGSGLAIEVGRDDPPGRLDERLAVIATHYPAIVARAGAEPIRIDVRYPQGIAVAVAARKKP